jgi:hypothetical protein
MALSLLRFSPLIIPRTDPDYQARDGIYAGYVVKVPEPGTYYVNVFVYHPNHMQPQVVPAGMLRFDSSASHRSNDALTKPEMDAAGAGGGDDGIAPSRINDLRLRLDSRGNPMGLLWTAPGDDANHGQGD